MGARGRGSGVPPSHVLTFPFRDRQKPRPTRRLKLVGKSKFATGDIPYFRRDSPKVDPNGGNELPPLQRSLDSRAAEGIEGILE